MNTRLLGRTGLRVSEVGFGAWAVGGNRYGNSYGPTDDDASLAAIHAALDGGCTFFDTADVYGHGHSEALLGQALAQRRLRDTVVLATKGGGNFYNRGVDPRIARRYTERTGRSLDDYAPDAVLPFTHRVDFDPAYIRFALEQSLRRLRTDRIDLYQLHNPSLEQIRDGGIFDVLDDLRQEGKILCYGVSIHDPAEGLAAIVGGRCQAIQVVYNLFSQDAARELFPAAQRAGVAIVAREPLANGLLSGKYNAGIPADSRAALPGYEWLAGRARDEAQLAKVRALQSVADDLGCTLAQLALAWCLKNPNVSTIITGASRVSQLHENMKALDVGSQLTPDVMARIDAILGNKPA